MLRIPTRLLKSIINMRKSAVLLLIIFTIGIFGVIQVFDFAKLCQPSTERSAGRRHIRSDADIPPKVLADLKKRWILEYEEERKFIKNEELNERADVKNDGEAQSSIYIPIDCNINGDYNVDCLRQRGTDNIYLPWTFIEKYFEVYGQLNHYDGLDRFEFFQSYAQVWYDIDRKYKYDAGFMNFETYNVEVRDRVKLITGVEGVPLSTQWGPQGYFYPIQIAQFGLSHFTKNITEKGPSKTVYENGEMTLKARWKPTNRHCTIENVEDREGKGRVMKFQAPVTLPYGSGIALTLGNTADYELSFNIKFITNGSLSVLLDTTEKKQYYIHYVTNKKLIEYDKASNIMIGIGDISEWRHISRNLAIDLAKGVGVTKGKTVQKVKIGIRKVAKLILRGEGFIDNVTLLTVDHTTHFLQASDWLLKNQNKGTGGWPIMVERKFPGFPPLAPGWHSAMAQGHGLSTMVRAYKYTKDKLYLPALQKALKPYTIPSGQGGVRAVFMNKYVWYEEYPTTPSSFVLNGFIYSLIGLYDYKMLLNNEKLEKRTLDTDDEEALALVTKLYEDGMTSLKNMLPLYDAGSRTIYDLRHFQLKKQPNVARWDYHTTHMSQLALLSTIDDDPIFSNFYDYWLGYLKGIPAKHN